MDKNRILPPSFFSKENLAVFLGLAMFAGFLHSRPALSITTILFGANALRGIHPREWLRQRHWLLGLGWLACYALSYFWSDDKHVWGVLLQVKLPFLLLPLAYGLLPPLSDRHVRVFTYGLCVLILLGIAYSLSFFFQDPLEVIRAYGVSHVLKTPARGNHICFSAATASVVAWCSSAWPKLRKGSGRMFVVIACIIIVAYLHLLAVKTGLVMLYVWGFFWVLRIAGKQGAVKGVILGIVCLLAVVAAFKWIPTLNSKYGYVLYSIRMYEEGERRGNYSDMGRVFSYDVALRLIAEHPIQGVGSGDLLPAMSSGYDQWYPQVPQSNRLFPHNQFMCIALAAGLPALLLFCIWWIGIIPDNRRSRAFFSFSTVWLMLTIPLLVEPFLEIQFGVFVYLFFLLGQRYLLMTAPGTEHLKTKTSSIP